MLYDYMTRLDGAQVGYPGYSVEAQQAIMDIYREGEPVFFQPPDSEIPGTRPAFLVIMEQFEFKEFAPPSRCEGYGGIGLISLRELG
jgi:hypothetical protein